jgi:hypothetical protein
VVASNYLRDIFAASRSEVRSGRAFAVQHHRKRQDSIVNRLFRETVGVVAGSHPIGSCAGASSANEGRGAYRCDAGSPYRDIDIEPKHDRMLVRGVDL